MESYQMEFVCFDDNTKIYRNGSKFYRVENDAYIEVSHIMRLKDKKVVIEWIDA